MDPEQPDNPKIAADLGVMPACGATAEQPTLLKRRIYRHSLPVRLFHWINAASFVLLLMSGLQSYQWYAGL